jgi:hypothetical protein
MIADRIALEKWHSGLIGHTLALTALAAWTRCKVFQSLQPSSDAYQHSCGLNFSLCKTLTRRVTTWALP